MRSYAEYDFDKTVYTIVVLTSVPRDQSVNFSYAVSDMNPVDASGQKVEVYPHRLVFLNPRPGEWGDASEGERVAGIDRGLAGWAGR